MNSIFNILGPTFVSRCLLTKTGVSWWQRKSCFKIIWSQKLDWGQWKNGHTLICWSEKTTCFAFRHGVRVTNVPLRRRTWAISHFSHLLSANGDTGVNYTHTLHSFLALLFFRLTWSACLYYSCGWTAACLILSHLTFLRGMVCPGLVTSQSQNIVQSIWHTRTTPKKAFSRTQVYTPILFAVLVCDLKKTVAY